MSYAKVDPLVWDDQNFCTLNDCERMLWLLLLTGPQTTALPGLQRVGVATLSETLRRPLQEVQNALCTLQQRGMVEFDEYQRVLRIPKSPAYNKAQSPNQIRAWWKRWQEIPEGTLKQKHLQSLKDHAKLEKPLHRKAWSATFGRASEGLPKGSPKPFGRDPPSPSEGLPHSVSVSASVSASEAVAVSEAPREAAETATAAPERFRSEPEPAPERPHRTLATPRTAPEPLKLAEPPTTPSAPVVEPDLPGERKERIERILVLLQNASELGKIANRTQAGRVYNLTHNTTISDRILEQVIDELNAKANPDWNEEVLSQKLGAYLRNARSHPHRYLNAPSALPLKKAGPVAIERYVPVPEPEDGIVLTKEIWDDLLKTMDNGMNPRSRKRAGNELRPAGGGRGQARGPARA